MKNVWRFLVLGLLALLSFMSSSSIAVQNNGVGLIVQYKNEAGKQEALTYARDGKFHTDIERFSMVSITVDQDKAKKVQKTLSASPNIAVVEVDGLVHALPNDGKGDMDLGMNADF